MRRGYCGRQMPASKWSRATSCLAGNGRDARQLHRGVPGQEDVDRQGKRQEVQAICCPQEEAPSARAREEVSAACHRLLIEWLDG